MRALATGEVPCTSHRGSTPTPTGTTTQHQSNWNPSFHGTSAYRSICSPTCVLRNGCCTGTRTVSRYTFATVVSNRDNKVSSQPTPVPIYVNSPMTVLPAPFHSAKHRVTAFTFQVSSIPPPASPPVSITIPTPRALDSFLPIQRTNRRIRAPPRRRALVHPVKRGTKSKRGMANLQL
jgi:hypothetical protein